MRYVMRVLCAFVFLIAGCGETINPNNPARILAIGDSLLASHSSDGASVSDRVEVRLGEQVIDRSVSGANVVNPLPISGAMGMRISEQYP
ncbi:MAG: SGNH/GDSL hydrolase family protein, partial [Proteobacteria bacterium]|nr:SGNH/GDSL hydrolase family protein [Pseudomonadota bacterium]